MRNALRTAATFAAGTIVALTIAAAPAGASYQAEAQRASRRGASVTCLD